MKRFAFVISFFFLMASNAFCVILGDKTSIDFGTTKPGEAKYGSLTVTNVGADNVTISDVVTEGEPFLIEKDDCSGMLEPGKSCAVVVKFMSEYIGSYAGNLRVFSNDGSVNVALFGTVSGQKSISVSRSVLDFGLVAVGTIGKKYVTVTNDGDVDIDVVGIEGVLNTAFSVNKDTFTLKPKESETLEVTFSPQKLGNFTANMTILTNDPSVSKTVILKGEAVGSNATYAYFTLNGYKVSQLVFPETFLLETTYLNVALCNPTMEDITIDSIQVPPGFSVNINPNFTVQAGSSISFDVAFSPGMEAKSFSGSLQFITDDGYVISLPVFGRGTDVKVTSSSGQVVFSDIGSIPSYYAKPNDVVPLKTIDFSVFGFYPLQSISVNVNLFAPREDIMFYKITANGEWLKLPDDWYDSVTKTLHLNLTDNGIYDLNPDTNIIEDPIVIAVPDTDVPPAESGNAGGGGGGGCSISNVTPINGAFTLLLLLLALAAGTFIFKRVGGTGEF